MRKLLLYSASAWLLSSCSQPFSGGALNMLVIQPTGPSCQYQVAPAPILTLDSLSELRGLLGRVVTHPDDLESDPNILDFGQGFRPLDARFSGSGNNFGPLDKSTLWGTSLYYALERGYFLFKNLDAGADLTAWVPNLRDTLIVQNAKLRTVSDRNIFYSDNAAYLQIDSSQGSKDYFLAFPNNEITKIPLGFNAGVMIHEFTHMVTQYFFHSKRSQAGRELTDSSTNVLNAFDEGNSDYFAFLATRDPRFFHCSFPDGTDRDLSHNKVLTSAQASSIRTSIDFDAHTTGAVWASVQYQIGELIGHEENGRSLVRFLMNLASCTGLSSSSAQVTFATLRNCHFQALGNRNSSQIQQIYQNAFSAAGGM